MRPRKKENDGIHTGGYSKSINRIKKGGLKTKGGCNGLDSEGDAASQGQEEGN